MRCGLIINSKGKESLKKWSERVYNNGRNSIFAPLLKQRGVVFLLSGLWGKRKAGAEE